MTAPATPGPWAPISLPPPSQERYEVKFLIHRSQLPIVQGWLHTHRVGWSSPFAQRIVNNAYFDTPDLDALQDNLAGVAHRRKVRLRWYGDTWQPTNWTLEIKGRTGSVGWKWQFDAGEPPDLRQTTWRSIQSAAIRKVSPALALLWQQQPVATLVNRYSRQYFLSRDCRMRLTVDKDLCHWPQRSQGRPQLQVGAPLDELVVLEMKCAIADRELAASALADWPLRVVQHSKFVRGMEFLVHR